jgi:hypothetical protein
MEAQTLEAIADLSLVGGQSIIGLMRQERNQAKLQLAGITLDNEIPGELDPKLAQILLANGTVATGVKGIAVNGVNCNPDNPTTIFTAPACLVNVTDTNQLISPNPYGYIDPNSQTFLTTRSSTEIGQQSPISEILAAPLYGSCSLGPEDNGTGPALCSPGTGPTIGSPIQLNSVINPFSTICGSICPGVFALSFFLAHRVSSLIFASFVPLFYADAMLLVILPVTLVDITTSKLVHSLAMLLTILPVPLVDITTSKLDHSLAMHKHPDNKMYGS